MKLRVFFPKICSLTLPHNKAQKRILRKMSLKFENFKFDIACKIAFFIYIFYFFYRLELFGVKRSRKHKYKWLNKIVCFNFLKN